MSRLRLRRFLYLDEELTANYLAQVEGGVYDEEATTVSSASSRRRGAGAKAGVLHGELRSASEEAQTTERTVRQIADGQCAVLCETEPERRERFAGYHAVLRELDPAFPAWMCAFAHHRVIRLVRGHLRHARVALLVAQNPAVWKWAEKREQVVGQKAGHLGRKRVPLLTKLAGRVDRRSVRLSFDDGDLSLSSSMRRDACRRSEVVRLSPASLSRSRRRVTSRRVRLSRA